MRKCAKLQRLQWRGCESFTTRRNSDMLNSVARHKLDNVQNLNELSSLVMRTDVNAQKNGEQ